MVLFAGLNVQPLRDGVTVKFAPAVRFENEYVPLAAVVVDCVAPAVRFIVTPLSPAPASVTVPLML